MASAPVVVLFAASNGAWSAGPALGGVKCRPGPGARGRAARM